MRPALRALVMVVMCSCDATPVTVTLGGGGATAGGGGTAPQAEAGGTAQAAGGGAAGGGSGAAQADLVEPPWLRNCQSMFAARIVEKQLETRPSFPEDCAAPLLTDVGQLNASAPLCRAGESANACRERLYATPPAPQQLTPTCSAGSNCLKAKWVPKCSDGSSSCAVPDAVCVDGLRPLAYVQRAAGNQPSNTWIFYMNGGGGPCSGEACWGQYRYMRLINEDVYERSLSSLHPDYLTDGTEVGTGIMFGAGGPDGGLPMPRFNRVKWDRCAPDIASDGMETTTMGNGTTPSIPLPSAPVRTRASGVTVWHKGLASWKALFRSLATAEGRDLDGDGAADMPSLSEATTVLLAASSDATVGLTYAGDALAAELRAIAGPGVEVRLLLDGFFEPGIDNALRFQAGASLGYSIFNHTWEPTDVCLLPDNHDGQSNEVCSGFNQLPGTAAVRTHRDEFDARGDRIDESCLADSRHGGKSYQCYNKLHVLQHHLSTPFTVVADREDPQVGGSAPKIAVDSSYLWERPEAYGAQVLAQANDLQRNWASSAVARDEGPGTPGNARLMLRKPRRQGQPWSAANHTHLELTTKLRWSMSLCSAPGQAPLKTVNIADFVAGTPADDFIVEGGGAMPGAYWVTGETCITPE